MRMQGRLSSSMAGGAVSDTSTLRTSERLDCRDPMRREPVISSQWIEFVQFCKNLGFGRIEKLEIQNGQPMMAEVVTEKVKFS